MIALPTILAWIQAGGTLFSEGKALYDELREVFTTDDQATLDAAVVTADAAADEAHKQSQE
jgi:hypothetical protein